MDQRNKRFVCPQDRCHWQLHSTSQTPTPACLRGLVPRVVARLHAWCLPLISRVGWSVSSSGTGCTLICHRRVVSDVRRWECTGVWPWIQIPTVVWQTRGKITPANQGIHWWLAVGESIKHWKNPEDYCNKLAFFLFVALCNASN